MFSFVVVILIIDAFWFLLFAVIKCFFNLFNSQSLRLICFLCRQQNKVLKAAVLKNHNFCNCLNWLNHIFSWKYSPTVQSAIFCEEIRWQLRRISFPVVVWVLFFWGVFYSLLLLLRYFSKDTRKIVEKAILIEGTLAT